MIKNIITVFAICAMIAKSSAFVVNRSRRSVDTCGIPTIKSGTVVGGEDFERGLFPWNVALLQNIDFTGLPPAHACGGTLVSRTFVISGKYFKKKIVRMLKLLSPSGALCLRRYIWNRR